MTDVVEIGEAFDGLKFLEAEWRLFTRRELLLIRQL